MVCSPGQHDIGGSVCGDWYAACVDHSALTRFSSPLRSGPDQYGPDGVNCPSCPAGWSTQNNVGQVRCLRCPAGNCVVDFVRPALNLDGFTTVAMNGSFSYEVHRPISPPIPLQCT